MPRGSKSNEEGLKVIATNRRARHEYTILESLEAGVELKGAEVKSVRAGRVNLKDSFARVEGKEFFLYNVHIAPYEFATVDDLDPVRPRRLLLHKREIKWLMAETLTKHRTLVPLKLYFRRGLAKVEIALAKGKRLYDKRRAVKEREAEREMRRAMRGK